MILWYEDINIFGKEEEKSILIGANINVCIN